MATSKAPANTYYDLLGLAPSASVQDIRRAYRDRSKIYHPDTTTLPPELAKVKFHELNEAYATLSSPERRLQYDQKIGYSRIPVIQVRSDLNRPVSRDRIQPFRSTKDYLDPTDRPLSAGEIFALFLLGITFVACLILVVTISLTQGESAFHSYPAQVPLDFLEPAHQKNTVISPSAEPSSPEVEPLFAPEFVPEFTPESAPDLSPAPTVPPTQQPVPFEENTASVPKTQPARPSVTKPQHSEGIETITSSASSLPTGIQSSATDPPSASSTEINRHQAGQVPEIDGKPL